MFGIFMDPLKAFRSTKKLEVLVEYLSSLLADKITIELKKNFHLILLNYTQKVLI